MLVKLLTELLALVAQPVALLRLAQNFLRMAAALVAVVDLVWLELPELEVLVEITEEHPVPLVVLEVREFHLVQRHSVLRAWPEAVLEVDLRLLKQLLPEMQEHGILPP